MISGDQLREALRLVGWTPDELAERAAVGTTAILDGMASNRAVRLTAAEESRCREILGAAGIIIMDRHRNDLGVKLLPD